MDFPGDLTPEERRAAFENLRKAASWKWGEERASVIEPALTETAVAIAKLDRLRFARDDAPGFYLTETAPEQGN